MTNEMKAILTNASHTFANGVTVFNSTPHALTFQDIDGTVVSVPSTVPEGERSGIGVINAKPVEQEIDALHIRTVFAANDDGRRIISMAKDLFGPDVQIIGSLPAANAYREVVGMIPAPGFERVPPAEKRMRVDRFNVGDCW